MGDPVSIGLAVASVGLGAAGQRQQRQAVKEQKEGQRIAQRSADVRAQRERIRQVREARIRQAQVEAAGFGAGAPSSSAVAGGISSLSSQLGSNIGALNTQQAFSGAISRSNQAALDAQSRAGEFGFASQIFANPAFQSGVSNAIDRIPDIFSNTPTTIPSVGQGGGIGL